MKKTILTIAIITGLFLGHQLKADDKLPITPEPLTFDVYLHSIKKGFTTEEYKTEKTCIKDKVVKKELQAGSEDDELAEYIEMLNREFTKKQIPINGNLITELNKKL